MLCTWEMKDTMLFSLGSGMTSEMECILGHALGTSMVSTAIPGLCVPVRRKKGTSPMDVVIPKQQEGNLQQHSGWDTERNHSLLST